MVHSQPLKYRAAHPETNSGILASNFSMLQGSVDVTVPAVVPGEDYSIICEFLYVFIGFGLIIDVFSVRRLRKCEFFALY